MKLPLISSSNNNNSDGMIVLIVSAAPGMIISQVEKIFDFPNKEYHRIGELLPENISLFSMPSIYQFGSNYVFSNILPHFVNLLPSSIFDIRKENMGYFQNCRIVMPLAAIGIVTFGAYTCCALSSSFFIHAAIISIQNATLSLLSDGTPQTSAKKELELSSSLFVNLRGGLKDIFFTKSVQDTLKTKDANSVMIYSHITAATATFICSLGCRLYFQNAILAAGLIVPVATLTKTASIACFANMFPDNCL